MELEMSERLVVPEQDLENKRAFVAKIIGVFSCDSNGKEVFLMGHIETTMMIRIMNKSCGYQEFPCCQILNPEDFKRFRESYGVMKIEGLIGKPVVSVYPQDLGEELCGLIPLNMDG